MPFPYRCSKAKCRKRISLKKKLEHYIYKKVCPNCGCDSLKLDKAKQKEIKLNTCTCDSRPYPHRKASNAFCMHSTRIPTKEDYDLLYAIR